ncbi:MAG: hypothetical protein ABSH29_10490 [Acidimicrobiales bacterium]|jgi:hypothetical protein
MMQAHVPAFPQLHSIVMCGIMAFAGVVALLGLQRGLQDAATTTTEGRATTTDAVPAG